MQRYIPFVIIICTIWGCKKPTDTTDNGGNSPVVCTSLPECNGPLGPEYYTEDTTWIFLAVNPDDPNEIAFWRLADMNLVVYNVTSRTATAVKPVTQMAGIRWSGEWILYNRYIDGGGNGEIYKIRPDGTGNQLLTAGSDRFYPTINPSHDKFLWDKYSGPVIMDFEGNVIRQVIPDQNVNFTPFDWYNDSLLLCSTDNDIYVLNMNSGHLEQQVSNPHADISSYFGFPVYVGNNQFVWQCISGLKKTDMTTGVTTTIVQSCNSTLYGAVSYTSSTNRFMCTKMDITNKEGDPCKQSTKTDLLWISPDGSAREVIDLAL